MKRDLFKGYAINAVDAKGRLSIPAAYRSTIEVRSLVKQVNLSLRFEPNHIRAFDEYYSDHIYEQIERRYTPDQEDERAAALQREFAAVEEQPYDSNGRIVLPSATREAVGITNLACFIAFADYFEIWEPHRLLASARANDPATVFHIKNLLRDRGETV